MCVQIKKNKCIRFNFSSKKMFNILNFEAYGQKKRKCVTIIELKLYITNAKVENNHILYNSKIDT